jgi:hypothetical protein
MTDWEWPGDRKDRFVSAVAAKIYFAAECNPVDDAWFRRMFDLPAIDCRRLPATFASALSLVKTIPPSAIVFLQ